MNESLEKYIKEQRDRLDVENPPEFILDQIKSKLVISQKRDFTWVWKAASVALLMVSSFLLFLLLNEPNKEVSLHDLSPAHLQLEKQYQESIKAINASIGIEKIDKKEYQWLFEELDYLESLNNQFRKDINDKSDKEKLVSILIDYYEKKLKILKKLEREINRKNHAKIDDHNS